jgi:hypothetical protein
MYKALSLGCGLALAASLAGCGERSPLAVTTEDRAPVPTPPLLASASEPGCAGMISGIVWHDANGNGIREAGETSLSGVTLKLLDGDGVLVATSSSDFFGLYGFVGLCAGDYVIEVDESTLPQGFEPAPCNVGDDDTIDNDCSGAPVTLADDESTSTNVDFGYVQAVSGRRDGYGPGYWRQRQHFDAWASPFEPGTSFESVFGRDVPGDPTLQEALNNPGRGLRSLMFHAVAALLNAASDDISFPFSVTEVVGIFLDGFDTGAYNRAKRVLASANGATGH